MPVDHPFGASAVDLGFTTDEQVANCLRLQAEGQRRGEAPTLPELLQSSGALTRDQVCRVLDHLRLPRTLIPGYELLQRIGKGGMGEVFMARQVRMDRVVALKILSREHAADGDYVQRFFAEARAAAQFNHRHLVAAYDSGSADGLIYFVMEYVQGRTLRAIVDKSGPLAERDALKAALAVAEALSALEERGMVHRDIKPENIMVTAGGVVKLCDFGLAKGRKADASMTQAGEIMGTPAFMSPEQARGEPADLRSDFYSLGATLYFLVCGRPPFDGQLVSVLLKHLGDPPPDPRAFDAKLSEGFSALVRRLMSKERGERPADGAELLDGIRSLLRRRASRRPLAWLAAGAAAVLLAGVLAFARPRPPAPAADAPAPPAPVDDKRQDEEERAAIQAAFDGGRWREARGLIAESPRRAAYDDVDRRCAREIEAEDLRPRVEAALRDGRWAEVERLAAGREGFDAARAETQRELAAGADLGAFETLVSSARWGDVPGAARDFLSKHGATRTGRAAAEKVNAAVARATEAERASRDARAAARIDECRRLAGTDPRAALDTLAGLEREFGGTHGQALSEIAALCREALRRRREQDAGEAHREAEEHLRAGRARRALEALEDLRRAHAETDTVRSRRDVIEGQITEAREDADPSLTTVFDFEGGVTWEASAKGVAAPKVEESPEAKRGRRCASFSFAAMTKSGDRHYAIVWTKGLKLVREGHALVFWARSGTGEPARFVASVIEGDGGDPDVYHGAEFTAGPEWERREIPLADFRADRPMNRDRVYGLAFQPVVGPKKTALLVDDVRLRRGPGAPPPGPGPGPRPEPVLVTLFDFEKEDRWELKSSGTGKPKMEFVTRDAKQGKKSARFSFAPVEEGQSCDATKPVALEAEDIALVFHARSGTSAPATFGLALIEYTAEDRWEIFMTTFEAGTAWEEVDIPLSRLKLTAGRGEGDGNLDASKVASITVRPAPGDRNTVLLLDDVRVKRPPKKR